MIATKTGMSTPLAPPVPRIVPMASGRRCLLPEDTGSERWDGARWPRSRNQLGDLSALIAAADPRFGRIDRVSVDESPAAAS